MVGKRDGMGRGMELCNTVLRRVLGGALNLFYLFMYLSRTYTHICMLDCVYICIHEYMFVCPCVWLGERQKKKGRDRVYIHVYIYIEIYR